MLSTPESPISLSVVCERSFNKITHSEYQVMWVKCLIGVLSKCSQHQKIQFAWLLCVKDAWTKQHTRKIKWFEWSVGLQCYRNALSTSVSNSVTCCFQMLHKKVLFRKWTEHFLESFWLPVNTDKPVFPHNGFVLSDEQPPFANKVREEVDHENKLRPWHSTSLMLST